MAKQELDIEKLKYDLLIEQRMAGLERMVNYAKRFLDFADDGDGIHFGVLKTIMLENIEGEHFFLDAALEAVSSITGLAYVLVGELMLKKLASGESVEKVIEEMVEILSNIK